MIALRRLDVSRWALPQTLEAAPRPAGCVTSTLFALLVLSSVYAWVVGGREQKA